MLGLCFQQTFQHCFGLIWLPRRPTMSNQLWNNVLHINLGIYNVEQCRISVFLFQRKYEQLQTSDFITLSSVEITWMLPFPKNMTLKFVAKNEIISLGIKQIFEIEYTKEGNLQGARKGIKEFEQFKDALIQKIILKCILDQTIRNCQTLFQWSREKCF